MNNKIIKLISGVLLCGAVTCTVMKTNVYATSLDSEALTYGVNIDTELFDVSWRNKGDFETYLWDQRLGKTYVKIGKAILKEKVNDMYYMEYVVACKTCPDNPTFYKNFLWVNYSWTEYAYLSYINLNVQINDSDVVIMDSTPKFTASDSSYSIGMDIGASLGQSSTLNLGFNASGSFVSKAINITNNTKQTSNNVDITIALNKPFWRADWQRYQHMSQDLWHYFKYTVVSKSTYFKQKVTVENRYETLNHSPNWWCDQTDHGETSSWTLNYV